MSKTKDAIKLIAGYVLLVFANLSRSLLHKGKKTTELK